MLDPGTAIGIVSLAFQAFAGCIQAFVLFTTADNIGQLGANFLCQLSLQEIQLTEWAKQTGLLNVPPNIDPRLNQEVIKQALVQLETFFNNLDKLAERYHFRLVEKAGPSSHLTTANSIGNNGSILTLLKLSELDKIRQDVITRSASIRKTSHIHRRLWWAAVDKRHFEEFLSDLRKYI